MENAILVINAGSSSIKFSLFAIKRDLDLVYRGEIENILKKPHIKIFDPQHSKVLEDTFTTPGHEFSLKEIFAWLDKEAKQYTIKAVGHRVVHGGTTFLTSTIVTPTAFKQMDALTHLAPLHQPHNLNAIKVIEQIYKDLPQVACFDTTFHRTQNTLATQFAIPKKYTDEGIMRYGFHGISYEYVAYTLANHVGEHMANLRVIIAHLGNGSSMCAMHHKKSVATSMGFTALDGLMMGTRCGRIDPGVLLHLLQHEKYSPEELNDLLYKKSGLLGVSGISHDVRELLSSQDANAKNAIDLYCYRAALEIGSLFIALGGLDVLVFTAGIGENSSQIRWNITSYLTCLGLDIDPTANEKNATIISEPKSKVLVAVVPTNEEYMIAKQTRELLQF